MFTDTMCASKPCMFEHPNVYLFLTSFCLTSALGVHRVHCEPASTPLVDITVMQALMHWWHVCKSRSRRQPIRRLPLRGCASRISAGLQSTGRQVHAAKQLPEASDCLRHT
jgi:hypothetical protein